MKNLVLYFSVYGSAKIVAEEIAKQTGAELVEIEPGSLMTVTGIITVRWLHMQRRNMTRISALR